MRGKTRGMRTEKEDGDREKVARSRYITLYDVIHLERAEHRKF